MVFARMVRRCIALGLVSCLAAGSLPGCAAYVQSVEDISKESVGGPSQAGAPSAMGASPAQVSSSGIYRWYPSTVDPRPVAVAWMIHGLNLDPARMSELANVLNEIGIDVLSVSLTGHRDRSSNDRENPTPEGRMESFKRATYDAWRKEALGGYMNARTRAEELNLPVYFVGYSLGGLIGVDLLASVPEVRYDRMILLSPAIRIRLRSHLLKIFSVFPRMVIPSASPEGYRANRGTPMAAYNALYMGINHLERVANDRLNVPTLVFADPDDELVSFIGLEEFAREHALNQWSIIAVEKNKAAESIRHLIITEEAVGTGVWQSMTSVIQAFLKK